MKITVYIIPAMLQIITYYRQKKANKRRKVLNREYMMVEKHLGLYHPNNDDLWLQQEGKCAFCNDEVKVRDFEEIQ